MSDRKELPPADATLDAAGASCTTLTPLIRTTIRGLAGGAVLEVRTDNPSARVDIPVWSRLTGNELLASVEEDAAHTRFFLRKK
ncbi:MAG: sulfurtransferase TusA family protein [Thermomicrobiales bacterium]